MADVKKTMADLTSTISRLSIVVQQTQQENKRLMENSLQNPVKSTTETPQPMEMSGVTSQSSRASSIQGEDFPKNYNKPRIDKWGLQFDGDTNKLAVEDFVFRVERLQQQYNVSWKEVLDNFHLFMKGMAEKWYWLYIQTNYVTEWETLKGALLKQYRTVRTSFELMRDMVERKQLPGESIDTFFFNMIQLRSRLDISMPENEMIKMIKRNLRDNVGRIVYPVNVNTVEELRICCLDAEKTFLKKDIRMVSNHYPRQVNELTEEYQRPNETENNEVAAINLKNPNNQMAKAIIICWNCRQNGHVFMDCPSNERAIFCYKCGKPDVISPNCVNCRNRNFHRNDGNAGDPRSIMNPQGSLQE